MTETEEVTIRLLSKFLEKDHFKAIKIQTAISLIEDAAEFKEGMAVHVQSDLISWAVHSNNGTIDCYWKPEETE